MKKRLKNIFIKTKRKHGFSLWICILILTVSLGSFTGCSTGKETAKDTSGQPEKKTVPYEEMAGKWVIDFELTDPSIWGSGVSAGNGMELSATGDFSYYIGIGVGGTGQCEEKNDRISVEIQPYEEHSFEKEILTLTYEKEKEAILMNWHDEEVYWKREQTESSDNSLSENSALENTEPDTFSKEKEAAEALDHQEIKNIVEKFAEAYFDGDADTIQTFLANTYEGKISTYEGTGTISDISIKGLSDTGEQNPGNESYVVSLEYQDSNYEDTFQYITFTFVRREDGFKILYYGLEG